MVCNLRIKHARGMHARALALLVPFLACASALLVTREANASCASMLVDFSQTSLYNMAFQLTPKLIVKDWRYADAAEHCVNMSYTGDLQTSGAYVDLRHVVIEKQLCPRRGGFTEEIAVRHIPIFDTAFANVSAYQGHPQTLLLSMRVELRVPWLLVLWQGDIRRRIQDLMDRYLAVIITRTCVDSYFPPLPEKNM